MDRINHPTAVSGRFSPGDPGTGTAATVVTADHMNAVQDELINLIEEAGLSPSSSDATQVSQAIRLLSGGGGGIRNAVINGDFRVWQRGTTFSGIAPSATLEGERYTADRWAVRADGAAGAGVATVTQQGFAVGQTDVRGARNYLRYQQTTAANSGGGRIRTKLEVIEEYAGTDVTVSVWLRAASAIAVQLNLVNVYSASSSAQVATTSFDVTTSWQVYTYTATLPSISGQTLSLSVAHLRLELALPAGSPQLDVARVQIEQATIGSPFEVRPIGLELALCQRYYEKSYALATAPGTATVLGQTAIEDISGGVLPAFDARFRVAKRATPTVAWYSPNTGAINQIHRIVPVADYAVIQTVGTSQQATGYPEISQAFDSANLRAHWTADADL